MKIIVINGYSKVGKSTFVRTLRGRLCNVKEWSVANLAKQTIAKSTEFSEQELKISCENEYRNALIYLTNLFQKTGDIWTDLETYIANNCNKNDILFIHCRDPKQFKYIYMIASRHKIHMSTAYFRRDGVNPFNPQDEETPMYLYDYQFTLPDFNLQRDYHEVVDNFIYITGLYENLKKNGTSWPKEN